MNTRGSCAVGRAVLFAGSMVVSSGLLLSAGALAADRTVEPGWVQQAFDVEFGTRYWLSFGQTGKDLYDTTGSLLVSRLTYKNLVGHSGEVFGKAAQNSFFIKGFAGLGTQPSGTLQDEDFPPVVSPYSSTNSSQQGGGLAYATIDIGKYFMETPNSRAGVFVGYNFFGQDVDAYGCTQTATNPGICVPAISTATKVITQNNDWHSLRLGVNGETHFGGGWKLSGEAAVLPVVSLSGADSHWLRICGAPGCFTGPVPEDGTGWGVQFEATLDYSVTDNLNVGIGGRYWHMQTSGKTHFENHIVGGGGAPQVVKWATDIFGLTAHLAVHY